MSDHRIILTAKQLKRIPGRSSELSSMRLKGMTKGEQEALPFIRREA